MMLLFVVAHKVRRFSDLTLFCDVILLLLTKCDGFEFELVL